jgi:type I restriction enzyme, R subunit
MPTEAQTRRELIDPRLVAAGWLMAPIHPGQVLSAPDGAAITEFPTENGPADYALVAGGKVAGIVEAKRLSLGPQNVLTQAERYARGLLDSTFNFDGLRAPFL